MRITVQYFDGCPNREVLDRRIAEALDGRADAEVTHQRVETAEDAARLGFLGSPTILIDGVDPFAGDDAPVGLACRVYRTPDGLAGSPTVEQLREALLGRAHSNWSTPGIENLQRGPLHALPIACALTQDTGRKQVEKWRAFDDDYLLGVDRTETQQIAHYAKVADSVQRLRELVAIERDCCSFVDWTIDTNHTDLRLLIIGSAEQLAALEVDLGGQDSSARNPVPRR
jgi:hypothetical protein